MREIKPVKCPRCGSTEWKAEAKIILRKGKPHVVGEKLKCVKCGYVLEVRPFR